AWQVPGCAVAIVRDGRVIYLKGFGARERGRPEPVTPDTIFPIGSCTKAFTTTAMAMLVDEGKMAWDDPVRKHLSYFHLYDPLADGDVRLRDLVTHRTGLASHDFLWYRSPLTPEERVRRLRLLRPEWPFRSHFQYQTTMFTAAGLAVAHAAGSPWGEVMRRRLFKPLGMTRTSLTTDAAQKDPDHASPHLQVGPGQIKVMPWYPIHSPEPAGSINSTARDLSRWVLFQLSGSVHEKRLVSRKNLEETHTPQMVIPLDGKERGMHPYTVQMSYGMAWVIQDYRGQLLVSHAGAIDGFRAHLTLLPRARIGIVLLNNLNQTQMNLALSNTLVDLLLALPHKDWNSYLKGQVRQQEADAQARLAHLAKQRHPNTHPTHDLAAYTGTYENPAYDTCRVTVQDGSLVWQWHGFTCPLHHFEYDTFIMRLGWFGEARVIFHLNWTGKVQDLKVLDPMDVDFRKHQ
ncbi:MAG TPA: serine hydrolase, partial [Gemmataceae bacterium]|nr:serine hydrolase [Gemmataceae bacterium]